MIVCVITCSRRELRYFVFNSLSSSTKHEFHVHLLGRIDDPRGTSVGPHFKGSCTDDPPCRPGSDLQEVGRIGSGAYQMQSSDSASHGVYLDSVIKLNGEDSIVGRSLAVHGDGTSYETYVMFGVIGIKEEGDDIAYQATSGESPLITRASCVFRHTTESPFSMSGYLEFVLQADHSLSGRYTVSGLAPGDHIIQLVQGANGCSDDGSSVLSSGAASALLSGDSEITADEFGVAEGEFDSSSLSFRQANGVVGKSIIIRGDGRATQAGIDAVVATCTVGIQEEHPVLMQEDQPTATDASCRLIPTFELHPPPFSAPLDIRGYVHLRQDDPQGPTKVRLHASSLGTSEQVSVAIHQFGDVLSEDTGYSVGPVVQQLNQGNTFKSTSGLGAIKASLVENHVRLSGNASVVGRSIALSTVERGIIATCVIGVMPADEPFCELLNAQKEPSSGSDSSTDDKEVLIMALSASFAALALIMCACICWICYSKRKEGKFRDRSRGVSGGAGPTPSSTAGRQSESIKIELPVLDGALEPAEASMSQSQSQSQAAMLPPGWEAHEDDDGNIYFYNVKENRSQWERPLQ